MSGPITPTIALGAQNAAPKGQVVQIASLPDGLKNNARSLRIEGEVIQQNKDGSVRVRTDQGDIDIQVRGKQPQAGAKIEVDIPAGNPPRTATIRPAPPPVQTPLPQQPLPQTPVTTQPLPTAPPPQSQPAPVPQQPQQPLPQTPDATFVTKPAQQASQLQPAPPIQTQPTTLPPLSSGQSVQITPLTQSEIPQSSNLIAAPDIDMPAEAIPTKVATQATLAAQKTQGGLVSNLLQAVKSVLPNAPALAVQPTSIATPPQALAGSSAVQQTTLPPSIIQNVPLVLSAKITSIIQPMDQRIFVQPTAQPATTTASSPVKTDLSIPLLNVTVSDVTVQNKPVISIPVSNNGGVQNFVLQASAANTPPGTQITLLPQITTPQQNATINTATPQTVATPTLAPTMVTSMPPAWRPLFPLMQAMPLWPVLDDVFQSFYQATPQAAQILGRVIPSPANAQSFGSAVMLFVAALKSGDMQAWLGDKKLEMIQKLGKADLAARLSGEASSLSQNADAAPTDWKSYPIPLLYQNEISKVLFHVRREPDEDGHNNDEAGTRFVMDVSLPRMGTVQLDAYVRGSRVDLIVRTELPISAPMQDAMRTAYANALDNTLIYGDIGFQSDVKNFLTILSEKNTGVSI